MHWWPRIFGARFGPPRLRVVVPIRAVLRGSFAISAGFALSRAKTSTAELSGDPPEQHIATPRRPYPLWDAFQFYLRKGRWAEVSGDPPEQHITTPRRPYPLWDAEWAGEADDEDAVCRHVLLVRHGQYDESEKDDARRGLTATGWRQAQLTGRRLSAMSSSTEGVRISAVHVSGMRRAQETAEAIARELPRDVARPPPDPGLNEGMPALPVPGWSDLDCTDVPVDGPRAEDAFQRYFRKGRRAREGAEPYECEVIVGHANMLRFFVCRALQLPPEVWLRMHTFNCSITYLIIMPNGRVQVRMLGDVGHLSEDLITFSGRRGWNWHGKVTKCLPGEDGMPGEATLARDAA